MKLHDMWFLCGNTSEIKYAGKFTDFDEADTALDSDGANVVWLFTSKPQIETPIGGYYGLTIGDCVTVEVSGGVADVTGCPDGIEIDIIDHDHSQEIEMTIVFENIFDSETGAYDENWEDYTRGQNLSLDCLYYSRLPLDFTDTYGIIGSYDKPTTGD